jgi:hypothetical protein
MLLRRGLERLLRDGLRRSAGGRGGLPDRLAGQAHDAPRHLELLVLRAHPLELEAEHRTGGGGKLAADRAADAGQDEVAERAADHRQGRLRHALEHPADRAADRRGDGLADRARRTLEQLAEELVEFLLIGDLEQFGGQLHLVGFAEEPFPLAAVELVLAHEAVFVGLQRVDLAPVLGLRPVHVVHRSLLRPC